MSVYHVMKLNSSHVDHTPQEAHCCFSSRTVRDAVIGKLEERIGVIDDRLNEIMNQPISLASRHWHFGQKSKGE
jgi:hypothetical protein